MLTFEQARAKVSEHFSGRPVQTYGLGDEKYFYIVLELPADYFPNCGEICAAQVNKETGETADILPYPTPDCGFWTATEKHGDYPPEEEEEDYNDDVDLSETEMITFPGHF